MRNYSEDLDAQLATDLRAITSMAEGSSFCDIWTKYRFVAIAAQSLLKVIFPPGEKILGILIELADKQCDVA